MQNQIEYYRDPEVRERIAEYCGGSALEPELCTAEYLVGYGKALEHPDRYISTPKEGFNWILDEGLDIFRSIWDKNHTLSVLDVEYFNLDFPGQVYLHQHQTFSRLETVYEVILSVFESYGLQPTVNVTGQGYHFSFQIQSGTRADLRLEKLGKLMDSVVKRYKSSSSKRPKPVSLRHGLSFEGMGRVMEYLAHRIIWEAAGKVELPIVITDVAIGKGKIGREAISIDLSCFGDPIHMRDLRCPFSTHQKHKVDVWKVGKIISDQTPVQVAIPRKNITLERVLHLRRNFADAARFAREVHCFMPDYSVNFNSALEDYINSKLRRFHDWFDSVEQNHRTEWERTYLAMDLKSVPPCVRQPLIQPNDNLLKPTNLQTLTRCLLARGWHPKHIAGLVRAKWESPHGWGDLWSQFDAGSRSAFYTRVFSGLIADGTDKLLDHNCISHQEKGYCIQPNCGYNLADYRWDGRFP